MPHVQDHQGSMALHQCVNSLLQHHDIKLTHAAVTDILTGVPLVNTCWRCRAQPDWSKPPGECWVVSNIGGKGRNAQWPPGMITYVKLCNLPGNIQVSVFCLQHRCGSHDFWLDGGGPACRFCMIVTGTQLWTSRPWRASGEMGRPSHALYTGYSPQAP